MFPRKFPSISANFRHCPCRKIMEVNDTPETDTARFQLTTGAGEEVLIEDDGDDVHVCRKCNVFFYDIQKYLEHKVKHDNYKVKYCRSELDKRMILPKLVEKNITRKAAGNVSIGSGETDKASENNEGSVEDTTQQGEEKENEGQKRRGRRGRKRAMEVDQDLVITEKPSYGCQKCSKKFNREAALRRHMDYDHIDDEEEEEADGTTEVLEDDQDEDYKPKLDIKEELQEAREVGDPEEMATLDRVIMAAAFMEQGGEPITVETLVHQVNSQDGITPSKQQKLSEEERALRKFACGVCGNKFKELTVLKTHQLTHTAKRDYRCQYDGCTYSFKTKGSLKRHMRRHTGERPYPCELCGRSFAESGALTRHLKARVPCTTKSDNELPRYGKKWAYEPNIPAAGSREGQVNPVRSVSAQHIDQLPLNKDTMIQQVSEIPVTLEPEEVDTNTETLTNVVHVLEDSLPDVQHKELFELDDAEGVEIVITDENVEESLTEDDLPQLVHPETEAAELEVPFSTPNVCKVCQEDCVSVDVLKVHLRTHLADTDCHCWMCHFICTSKEEFENHLLVQHQLQIKSSTDTFQNLINTSETENKTEQPKNKSEVYRDAQIAVKQLLFLSQDQPEAGEDKESAGDKTLYKCVVCNKQFRGSNYLKLHMRNHTGLRPHKCSQCGKGFITKDTLNKHMSSHADERNFKCGECGKLFKRLSHVREHLKTHSGTRPFHCGICDKSFKTNNAMKVHLRTHTDILPYECTFCHRRFREKGSVLRHMRMHTGEKPYECQYCGRGFAEHGTLNRHLKAKVSCNRQLQECEEQPHEDYTVLAEFSSVVADTQQYIVEGTVETTEEQQVEETIVHDESQQAAEYVVLQTGLEGEEIQNVEIITGDGEQSKIGSIQVTDDYVVVSDLDEGGMRIINKATGQVVAVVPGGAAGEENEVQTITMSQDGEVSMVTLMPEGDTGQPGIETLLDDGTIIEGTLLDQDNQKEIDTNVTEHDVSIKSEKDIGDSGETVTINAGELTDVSSGSVILHSDGIQYSIESNQVGIQQVLEAAQELEGGLSVVTMDTVEQQS